MRAGQLDRRITIQSLVDTVDGTGSNVKTTTTLATVWAQKVDLRGTEALEAGKLEGRQISKFRIRFLTGVTTKHQISYSGQNYNIISIAEMGRREGLEFMAEVVDVTS